MYYLLWPTSFFPMKKKTNILNQILDLEERLADSVSSL